MIVRAVTLGVVIAALAVTTADAVMISLSTTTRAATVPGFQQSNVNHDTVDDTAFAATDSSVDSFFDETASAFAYGDAEGGVLRSRVSSDTPPGPAFDGDIAIALEAAADSSVTMDTFATVVGTGEVGASLAYDGSWSVSPQDPDRTDAVIWQAQGALWFDRFSNVAVSDTFRHDSSLDPVSGSTAGTLSVSKNVLDGDRLRITSYLLTQLSAGTNGIVDFSNTAYLALTLSEGVSLIFDDDRFLSVDPLDNGDGDLAAVPAPASIILLLTAITAVAARARAKPPN